MLLQRAKFYLNGKINQAIFSYTLKKHSRVSYTVLAHHGIQRSGTNYLATCLNSLKIPVININDPSRNTPGHKHFRWYSDKTSIPYFLLNEYNNDVVIRSVQDLNKICGFPVSTVHIVTRKCMDESIVSLMNFGIRCGWFDSKTTALAAYDVLKRDYKNYYEFWEGLEALSPDTVTIIDHNKLKMNPYLIVEHLRKIGFYVDCSDQAFEFDTVRMSPKSRLNYITIDEIITK